MFTSSLLWLLMSQYINYMIKTAAIYQNYYATYYLTYWWLELGLTQVKYHGYWFESVITTTWSSCRTPTCVVETTISSRSSVVADTYEQWDTCPEMLASWWTTDTYMTLWSWDCFIVPLYYDTATGFDSISYDTPPGYDYKIPDTEFLNVTAYNPTLYNMYTESWWTGEIYSLRIIDESLNNLSSLLEPTTESPEDYAFSTDMPTYSWSENNYLIVANPTSTTKSFCLQSEPTYELPMKYVNIVSIGEDGDNTISLNAVKNNELPSFLCYWAINP